MTTNENRPLVTYEQLVTAVRELRRLDRVVERMSDSDMRDQGLVLEHLAAVADVNRQIDAILEAIDRHAVAAGIEALLTSAAHEATFTEALPA